MSAERYAGAAGYEQLRKDEEYNSAAARGNREAARRDLQVRCPYGRALDGEDLDMLLDQGNQSNRANVMRARLLAEIRKSLPLGILIDGTERELLRADSIEHPTSAGQCAKVAEWPASR